MNETKIQKKNLKRKRIPYLIIITLGVFTLLTVGALVQFYKQMDAIVGKNQKDHEVFERHYALIMQNPDAKMSEEIWQGCREEGLETGAYVELFGEGLDGDYSREELIRMAIAAEVDGIILEAGEKDEIRELIDEATTAQIPVVTVLSDCIGSERKSYVGIGGYNLGREYGRQIIKTATTKTRKALVLLDGNADDSTQNIICNGIRETLTNEGNHLRLELEIKAVDSESTFSAEESIRAMLINMEELPDIIICLNEQNTRSVYQAVVDYNIVGEVDILGYYTSDTILQAVEKEILSATIAIDFNDMGSKCVDALNEYIDTGYVNGYYLVEAKTVNSNNIKEYLKDDSEAQK